MGAAALTDVTVAKMAAASNTSNQLSMVKEDMISRTEFSRCSKYVLQNVCMPDREYMARL